MARRASKSHTDRSRHVNPGASLELAQQSKKIGDAPNATMINDSKNATKLALLADTTSAEYESQKYPNLCSAVSRIFRAFLPGENPGSSAPRCETYRKW